MERENQRTLILVFAQSSSPRLLYILEYLLGRMFGLSFQLTLDIDQFNAHDGKKICYASNKLSADSIHIYPNGLLFEEAIGAQVINIDRWNGVPIFFQTEGDVPFDIFAASFYLISRYEEYLPHKLDKYGRYDHTQSIAFQKGFLQRPIVEEWMYEFCRVYDLQRKSSFTYQPTYDIDQAWSWKHKGWKRNLGGWIRDIIYLNTRALKNRLLVLAGKKQDPFDAFDWMDDLHQQLNPFYFFILAKKNGQYDKQILPSVPAWQALIKKISARYTTGIHPSWAAHTSDESLKEELTTFQAITGATAMHARYHYIAFTLPHGYQRLIEQGIRHDHSMGYGSINGFRASTSIPFKWFDLSANKTTDLEIHPFCWMDANSYYEQQLTADQALVELNMFKEVLKKTGGQMQVIWHNNFLGTDPQFVEWRKICERFTRSLL